MKLSAQVIVKALVGLCIFISAVGYSFYSHADNGVDTRVYSINVHASNAADALNALAFQTGAVMLFPYREAKTRQANAVVGDYTIQEAITLMLKDSGLIGSLTSDGAIKIFDSGNQHLKKNDGGRVMNSKKNLLASTIAFFVGVGGVQGVAAEEVGVSNRSAIDEIIVTASKRETSLQDTAMSISALTGDTIDKRGLVGMGDYLSSIPGVTVQDRGAGQNSIIIRGLSGDPQLESPTTGTYFGETSVSELGTMSSFGGAASADIKLVDIERIEVLRGPQGTLYGSGSIGGTVRVIPVAPNLEKFEGKIATRFSQTSEEGGDNTMLQGVLNIPLIDDTLAIRSVVYQFDNSGYINNVAASQPARGLAVTESFGGIARDRDDVGNDSYKGFRLSALWHPIDPLDITLSYLQQKIKQDGIPEIELDLTGDYDQRRLKTGSAGSHDEFLINEIDITNLVVEYDLDWATITNSFSLVNYNSEREEDHTTIVFIWGAADQPYYHGTNSYSENTTNELRLASQLEGPLQFSAGLYYENIEKGHGGDFLWSGDPNLTPDPTILLTSYAASVKQKAAFSEISYNITDHLKATLGGRFFNYAKTDTILHEIFFGTTINLNQPVKTDETGHTAKANLSYQATDNILVYGDWSEGFRLGSGQVSNALCTAAGFPNKDIESDTSTNFELGLKSSFADNRITLNASVYRVDWEGIPVFINPATNCFQVVNAGEAKSEGVELELQAYLTEKLRLDLGASYNEAKLGANSESIGNKGDNLPGSADVNATLGLQYDFTFQGIASFARIDYAYLGEYYSNVKETGIPAGNYSQLNAKAGFVFNQIAVDLFVNNATNNNGLSWVSSIQSQVGLTTAHRIRPRTIGINMSYQF